MMPGGYVRGGYARGHSHSSGLRGGMMGGLLGGSHSSGHRGRYVQGGHYRPARRGGLGCLGVFAVGAALVGSGVAGLLSLLG